MRNSKRIISLLLAGTLLFLIACSGRDKDSDDLGALTEGRFAEIDITPPIDGRFSSFLAADGTIICFDAGLATRYESRDNGGTWSESPGPGRGTDRFYAVQTATLLPDGSLLAFIYDEGLISIAPDGSSSPYPISGIDEAIKKGESVVISLLQAMDNDRLLLSYSAGCASFQSLTEGTEGSESPAIDDPISVNSDQAISGGMSGSIISGGTSDESNGDDAEESEVRVRSSFSGSTFSQWESKTLLLSLATGETIKDLAVEGAKAAASDGTDLYLMDRSGTITLYNVNDGSHSGKPEIKLMSDDLNSSGFQVSGAQMIGGLGSARLLALRSDGKLYAEMGGELLLAGMDEPAHTVLERTSYAIGTPRNSVDSIFLLDDESIVVNILHNGQRNLLYKYIWDENASVNPGKTLTIWSLEDNSFVRATISEMRKKHPDATIHYDVALDGMGAMSTADAIRSLNTRLLGGDAPDIIILDGIAIDSYVDRGMLLDLSDLLDTGDVFENLLMPFSRSGKLYSLPAQFRMPVLAGSSEALDLVQALEDLVALVVSGIVPESKIELGDDPFAGIKEDQRPALYFSDLKELSDLMWASASPGIVADNRLDSDALRRYLETVKAISDKLGLADDAMSGGSVSMSMGYGDGSIVEFLPGSLMRYIIRQSNYAAFFAGSLMPLQTTMDRDDSAIKLFPGLSPGVWQPSTVAGVSADTRVPEFAAEFIQTMLSLEVQRLNYGTGLPVTRAGLAAQIDFMNEGLRSRDTAEIDIDFAALVSQLQTLSMSDTVLKDMMWGSIERLCRGETDVEGAVREIEQSIRTYLAERA